MIIVWYSLFYPSSYKHGLKLDVVLKLPNNETEIDFPLDKKSLTLVVKQQTSHISSNFSKHTPVFKECLFSQPYAFSF